MSIFKAVSENGNPLSLLYEKAVYVLDLQKTNPLYACGFIGKDETTRVTTVLKLIEQNKKFHGQNHGKAFHHFILRFDDSTDESIPAADIWNAAHDVGQMLCGSHENYFFGLMALHFDSAIPHAHYLIDNVEIRSGKRMYRDKTQLWQLKNEITDVLTLYGISAIRSYDKNSDL